MMGMFLEALVKFDFMWLHSTAWLNQFKYLIWFWVYHYLKFLLMWTDINSHHIALPQCCAAVSAEAPFIYPALTLRKQRVNPLLSPNRPCFVREVWKWFHPTDIWSWFAPTEVKSTHFLLKDRLPDNEVLLLFLTLIFHLHFLKSFYLWVSWSLAKCNLTLWLRASYLWILQCAPHHLMEPIVF